MGYGVKIYQAACKELEDRRRRAEEKAAACRERFFEDAPGPRKSGRRWPATPLGQRGQCSPAGTCARN